MNVPRLLTRSILPSKAPKHAGRRNKPEPCKKYHKITTCIFDLDGVVLDNHSIMDNGYKAVFAKHRLEYTTEWGIKIMGMTSKELWEKVIKDQRMGNVSWEQLHGDYKQVIGTSLSGAPLRKGVERLLDHLHKHLIPVAAVTSSTRATMEAKTSHIKHIMAKFSHVVCAGDDRLVKHSKPAGDVYTACAAYFLADKPEPENCLVFEDTHVGVIAAMTACMHVVGICCPPTTSKALRHADEVLNSLTEFYPLKYGIPPFPEQVEPPVPW